MPDTPSKTPRTDAARKWAEIRGWPTNTHPLSRILDEMALVEREVAELREVLNGVRALTRCPNNKAYPKRSTSFTVNIRRELMERIDRLSTDQGVVDDAR